MTSKKSFAIGLCLIVLAVAATAFTRFDDPIQKIIAQLEKWSTENPQEKVHLQFDKPYYAVGDNIWFKAYITVGGEHKLSAISGALNVELLDERDSVRQWVKLPVVNGVTWGDFALSDTLSEGTYRVRAYTNWMRNAGSDYFFDRTIVVGNAATNTIFTKTSYDYKKVNGQQQVTATINYTDINGAPYVNREIDYTVKSGKKQLVHNKVSTDSKGNVIINFTSPGDNASGLIVTKMKVAEKKYITKNISIRSLSDQADVQFFPESGNMVNGIRSRVAFKAIGSDGLGVDIKGTVTDNNNTPVAAITTHHLGMGIFAFTPEAGKTYKAAITYPDGSQGTVQLPAATTEGYVLSINNISADTLSFRINCSAGLANNEVFMLAQSGGTANYVAKNKPGTTSFGGLIPKSKFSSGIVQFTLFNANSEPLNERIAFVQNNGDLLKLQVNTPKTVTAPRERVKINFKAHNNDGKPVTGLFSASVIDESKVPNADIEENSILSDLLLTADIKGYIEQPNYYFTDVNNEVRSNLDILMMTQGYRRFAWKALLSNSLPALTFQPEKSLQISGTVKNGSKPVPNAKVKLLTTSGGLFFLDTVADNEGHFVFKNLTFKDSIRFVIQARTAKDRKYVDIVLDKNMSSTMVSTRKVPANSPGTEAALSSYLKFSKKLYDEEAKYGFGNHTIQLREVSIVEKKENPLLKNSSNLNGAGHADQVISGDIFQNMGCATIDQCLQGRVLGVTFRGGVAYSTRSPQTPMHIVLDGINMEPEDLEMVNPQDIASIEVLRSAGNTAIYGSRGGGGILVINTRRGDEFKPDMSRVYAPGVITYTPKGYFKSREFYAPKYDDPKTNAHIADLRTTIHWAPNLITDKDGNASFTFDNAGSKATYRVTIEGIDGDGNLGRQVYRYQVQ